MAQNIADATSQMQNILAKQKAAHLRDGIRDFCLSRGLGDVYKRQGMLRLRYSVPCHSCLYFVSSNAYLKRLSARLKHSTDFVFDVSARD